MPPPSQSFAVHCCWCIQKKLGFAHNILVRVVSYVQALPISRAVILYKVARNELRNMGDGYGSVSAWNTEKVQDLSYIFSWRVVCVLSRLIDVQSSSCTPNDVLGAYNNYFCNRPTLTEFKNINYTSNVSHFNSNISNWNVSKVTTMEGLFDGCVLYNHPLTSWDTSSVTNMSYMFSYCLAFDYPLHHLSTVSVTSMHHMFCNCQNFNQPLEHWDTSRIQDFTKMFYRCYQLDQSFNGWCVSQGVDFTEMFAKCIRLNHSFDAWDLRYARYASNMFAFTQRLVQSFSSEAWRRILDSAPDSASASSSSPPAVDTQNMFLLSGSAPSHYTFGEPSAFEDDDPSW